jgi:hypothetical protein
MSNGSLFGNFGWLSAFQSDAARLAAITMPSVAFVLIYCIVPLAREWGKDQRDRRAHELERLALTAEITHELERRKRGRLDLDA